MLMKEVLVINIVAAALIDLSVCQSRRASLCRARPGLSCRVYWANKDLLAEPTFSSETRTTDLCSAGSLFLSLLCTRQEMK